MTDYSEEKEKSRCLRFQVLSWRATWQCRNRQIEDSTANSAELATLKQSWLLPQ